jgi:hypothetical protein
MAVDYTLAKTALGGVSPLNLTDKGPYQRLEPMITPEKLRQDFLFGVPLASFSKDPITGKKMLMTDDMLKGYIDRAIEDAEQETSTTIMPAEFKEKYPFDRCEYLSFGYLRLNHRPVFSVESMNVTPANQVDVFTIPLDWMDVGHMVQGQVNLIPIGIALNGTVYGGGVVTGVGAGAAAFLAILGNQYWIPAFWQILYSAGYPDGLVPRYINELIGTIAAIKVLSMLAATYRTQSSSLGIDGLSQSVSGPGPQLFETRIAFLQADKKKQIKVVRKNCGLGPIFSGNV